jgi:hypothetical protein
MNRREFITTCAAVAAIAATSLPLMAEDAKPPLPDYRKFLPLRSRVTIPEWAKNEIATALNRYKAWKGDDMTVSFPIVTDIHSRLYDFPENFSFSDSKMHTLLAQKAAEEANADFVADVGDIDLDIGVPITKDWPPKFRNCTPTELMHRVAVQQALYAECKLPVLFAVGNHDHSAGRFSSAEFGSAFNVAVNNDKGFKLNLCPTGDYGFYDMPAKKTRAIFLNTSDEGYYGYSIAQLNFFVNALATIPEGWTAVVLQHFCIQTVIGHWVSFPDTKAKRQEIAIKIMEDFVAAKQGEAEGIKWNFAIDGKRWFAGCLCGDSHFDNYLKSNGVDYTISQGYGGIRDADMIPGAYKTAPFARDKQMLVDFVAIKPAKHEVKLFRIGMGGAERDRGYSYNA